MSATNEVVTSGGVPDAYNQPEGQRTLGHYLKSANGVKTKNAIQHEKRVEYFKGMSSKKLKTLFSSMTIVFRKEIN